MPDVIEYWKIQNTGWSGGVSWFDHGGSASNPLRFGDEATAVACAHKAQWGDESVFWRVVHVRIERFDNKRVTTEEWIPISFH